MYFPLKTISALRGNSLFGKGFKYLFVTRYNSGVIRSSLPDIDIPNITIPEYVFRNFTKYPHRIAVECNLTGKRYTFEEVFVKSRNLNRSLRKKLNLKPGDIVALLLPNIPEYPICILGALMANLKVTTINPNHTPTEISDQLVYANAKAIVTLTTLTTVVQASIKLAERHMPIIGIKMQANTSAMLIKCDTSDNVITSPYEHGELLVKGPQVMKGYYNREEENKNAFINGWFKTGDLAYYDENELFFISERVKELIKVKGYQVSPAELEGVLRQHPDVIEAAVIGVAHKRYGEVPRAYIVPRPNHKINIDHVQTYLAEKLANYKQMKGGIKILDNIPKSASGKILRKELRKKYIEELKQ